MKLSRTALANGLVGLVIGAAFGFPLGQLLPGSAVGAVLGLLAGVGFERFQQRRWPHWPKARGLLVLVFVQVLLTLFLLVPAYAAYLGMRPARIPVADLPADLSSVAQPVSLTATDGIALSGWYLPSSNGAAIIALHGQGANRLGLLLHARVLAEHGYGVLMMDLRGNGESEGRYATEGWTAQQDLQAMVAFLKDQDVEQIGGVGLSAGAVTLLHAAAQMAEIEAIVADGTGVADIADLFDPLTPHPAVAWMLVPQYWLSYRFQEYFTELQQPPSLRSEAERIAPRPILYIAGAESMWEAELAEKYAAASNGSAQVWVVPGAGHIEGIQAAPQEYAQRMLSFFDAALLGN